MRCLAITVILLVVAQSLVLSQTEPDTTYKDNIVPSPSFTYSPETDIVLGVFALYQFKTKRTDYGTRPSFVIAYAAASLNNQVTGRFEHTVFISPLEKWYLKGLVEIKKWPELFFGIGPESEIDSLKISSYEIFTVDQKAYINVGDQLFVGIQFRYMNTYNIHFYDEDGEELTPPELLGKEGGPYVGIGFGVLYDKRNSILTPTENYYLEASTYFYSESLGSTSSFFSLLLDARRYINFNTGGKHILALQGKAMLTSGDVPFLQLAKMGGKEIMRGYLEGRYRDKQYFQMQAEYRVNLIGRFGMTAFGGFGNVMPRLGEFDPATIKGAMGMGFRFNINRKDPANIRIDFGYGFEKGANGVYITFGEAF